MPKLMLTGQKARELIDAVKPSGFAYQAEKASRTLKAKETPQKETTLKAIEDCAV